MSRIKKKFTIKTSKSIEEVKSLDLLFKPRNVVIFEAKQKVGYFIEGLKSQGFNLENLYLISPSNEKVSGLKCYDSFDSLPIDTIDLLILSLKRELVVQSLKDIIKKKKINFIHFFTAGMGESDEEGLTIENQIRAILENPEVNTQAIGPNCFGIYCPSGKNAYMPFFPNKSGNIGIISHSGDMLSRTVGYGALIYNLRFSKCASIGNCVSLQVSDFLEYFNQDDETDFIFIYFEGFSRYEKEQGRKMFDILKNINKPVLILRGGKTKRGQSAVLSHTGSLGTPDRIWHAMYKQTPLIGVGSSIEEVIDHLYLFYEFYKKNRELPLSKQINKFPKGKNALVIIWSGGIGIIDTDVLSDLGFDLPLFKGEVEEKLKQIYPVKVGSLSNPLDLPWVSRSEKYLELCKAAISEKIDLVIMHTDARFGRSLKKRIDNLTKIKDYVESLNKILILILPETPEKNRIRYFRALVENGFIVFPELKRAGKAYLALYNYGKKIRRMRGES
jgi:acetyl-CoA synthetase (ADP-forming)